MNEELKPILIISHRRSGRHLTVDALRNNSHLISKDYINLDRVFAGHPTPLNLSEFKTRMKHANKRVIIVTHLSLSGRIRIRIGETYKLQERNSSEKLDFLRELLTKSHTIYVYRDGRDVMTSLYHYIKGLNDYEYRVSFLEHLKEQTSYWCEHVRAGLNEGKIFRVSFEDFATDYIPTLKACFNFLGLNYPRKITNVYGKLPSKKSKLKKKVAKLLEKVDLRPSISAVEPRKGLVGDWKNHFGLAEKRCFKSIAGELLIDLGYEESLNW